MKLTIFVLISLATLSVAKGEELESRIINHRVDDSSTITVTYSYRYIRDTTKRYRYEDRCALQIGHRYTKFYSLLLEQVDIKGDEWSKSKESKKVDAGYNAFAFLVPPERPTGEEIYCDYPNKGALTEMHRLETTLFQVIELKPQFNWQMDILGQTEQILGYKCAKATTTFRGRRWEVWFTTEIPISSGPWKLCGLPGMILKATDNSGYFKYEAIGITQRPQPIYLYNDDIKTISRKEMRRLLDMRWKDPLGLFFAFRSKTRFVKTVNGQLVDMVSGDMVFPYIPLLELE